MPGQFYHFFLDYLRVDVHGCSVGHALSIVERRVNECYRFGIPFLEIVHGSGEIASEAGRKSIGECLDHFDHTAIRTIIALDYLGNRCDGPFKSKTATRFCLKANQSPSRRNKDVVFKGYRQDFVYKPYLANPFNGTPECFTYGTEDFKPFERDCFPLPDHFASVYEVDSALCGYPLALDDKTERTGVDPGGLNGVPDIPLQRTKEVTSEVLGIAMVRDFQNHLDFDDDKLENLDISPKQFQQIRSGILKGYKTARPVAMEVGSRLEFLDGTSPGCFQKPSFVMNRLSEDGDCILERCYPVDKLPALRNC